MSLFLGLFILTSVWLVCYTCKRKTSLLIKLYCQSKSNGLLQARRQTPTPAPATPAVIRSNYFWRLFYGLSMTGLCGFLWTYWDRSRIPVAGDFLKCNYGTQLDETFFLIVIRIWRTVKGHRFCPCISYFCIWELISSESNDFLFSNMCF